MKRILLIFFAVVTIFTLASAAWYYSKLHANTKEHRTVAIPSNSRMKEVVKKQASNILPFIKKNNYNTEVCFLVNMNIASGANRFFVYDLKNDSVSDAGLVTHGRCNETWLSGRKYDNKIGCGCTSLGKYRIGKPYKGKFGLAYKLHGLDSTNSNAFKRYVVLHSHDCVPEGEVDPLPICQSDGCPTVSPAFLQKLAAIIDVSPKPILLSIVDDQ